MRKFKHLSKRPLVRSAIILLAALICFSAIAYVVMGRPPNTLWLPNSSAYSTDDDILYLLPVKERYEATLYGRGLVYTSANGSSSVYEFAANPLLDASKCPNISGRSSLDPTKCEIQGNFNGSKLYGIDRSDASSLTEQFIQLGNTFVYIVANFNRGTDYIHNFIPVPHNQINSYLANTEKVAGPITARQQQAKSVADQKAAIAYTKLPFTPALPKTLPTGWQMLTKITGQPIQVDGPDADHPMLVSTDYTNDKNIREDVEFHVGLLSAFQIGGSCGPTPGYSMQNLPCTKVPGTDYYEASLYDNNGDFVRYLYRPLGNSLVITEIELVDNGGTKPTLSPELERAQNAITSSALPIDKSVLKGSAYSMVFY